MANNKIQKILPKEELHRLYATEKRSYRFMFKCFGINSARIIKRSLTHHGITIRHGSEAVALQWAGNEHRRMRASDLAKKTLAKLPKQPMSDMAKKKLSDARKGSGNPMYGRTGRSHPNYLGGRSNWGKGRKMPPDKKAKIRQALGNKCVKCDATKDLTIDHVIPWRISRSHDISNLRILCKKCHFRQPMCLR